MDDSGVLLLVPRLVLLSVAVTVLLEAADIMAMVDTVVVSAEIGGPLVEEQCEMRKGSRKRSKKKKSKSSKRR